MEADKVIDQLLEQSGAKLTRHAKHDVYELPGGGKFVRSRTPSDHRSAMNSLSDLRKALRGGNPALGEADPVEHEPLATSAPEPEPFELEPPPAPEPSPARPPTFTEKLMAFRESQEKVLSEHMAKAQHADSMIKLIQMIESSVSSNSISAEAAECLFKTISPPTPVAAPKPPPPPPPPQAITSRVQVTEQLVYAAAVTLGAEFDTNEVLETMIAGRPIDPLERSRIRQSVWSCMSRMVDRGKMIRTQDGRGRRPALFSLAGRK